MEADESTETLAWRTFHRRLPKCYPRLQKITIFSLSISGVTYRFDGVETIFPINTSKYMLLKKSIYFQFFIAKRPQCFFWQLNIVIFTWNLGSYCLEVPSSLADVFFISVLLPCIEHGWPVGLRFDRSLQVHCVGQNALLLERKCILVKKKSVITTFCLLLQSILR